MRRSIGFDIPAYTKNPLRTEFLHIGNKKRLSAEKPFSAKSLVTLTGMYRQTFPPRMLTIHFNYSLSDCLNYNPIFTNCQERFREIYCPSPFAASASFSSRIYMCILSIRLRSTLSTTKRRFS